MTVATTTVAGIVPSVALPVFAFYLLVACNYVKEIFGCQLQNALDNSILAKHAVSFILLFFLVVLVNPDLADTRIPQTFLLSIGIYAWFLMTTRTPIWVTFVVLLLLLASYLASIAKARYVKDDSNNAESAAKKARTLQYVFAYTALGLSVIGFALYAIEKKREYGSKFDMMKFFSGTLKCRGYTPRRAKTLF